jgi:phosphinothricin acetyltransferase
VTSRPATPDDATSIARIYNQGIEDRIATFETRLRTPEEVRKWLDGVHPLIVVEEREQIIAFAGTSQYRPRDCYARIAEFSVYVARESRGRGAGKLAIRALISAAEQAGFYKLISRIFVENQASRKLVADCGFHEVGIYEKHGKLEGVWRDVVIVERLLAANIT